MNVSFAQFCAAAPAAYETLRRQIDRCAQQGRSLEFARCQMPEGCQPAQTALGFSQQGKGYLLYWRPAVNYRGGSRVLAALFSRSVWRFCSYEAMTGRLLSLSREAGTLPYRPAPLAAEPRPLQAPSPPPPPSEAAALWPPLYSRLRQLLSQNVFGQERAVEAAAFRLSTHIGKQAPARPLAGAVLRPAVSVRVDRAEYLHPAPLRPSSHRCAAGLCGL